MICLALTVVLLLSFCDSSGSENTCMVSSCSSYILSFLKQMNTRCIFFVKRNHNKNTYCSIHNGFSVVLSSSTNCFLINASLRCIDGWSGDMAGIVLQIYKPDIHYMHCIYICMQYIKLFTNFADNSRVPKN